MLWVLLLACKEGGKDDDSSAHPVDDSATDDSGQPSDDCDGHAGELVCVDGAAVSCDAAGDPISTDDCSVDPSTACFDGQGCGTCTPLIAVAWADPSVVESKGIFLAVDASGSTDVSTRWMSSRSVSITVDPVTADDAASLVVDVSDPILQVLAPDGTAMKLPATLPVADATLVVWSDTPGKADLVVRFEHPTASCTEVESRLAVTVAADPGLSGRPTSDFPWFETVRAFNDTEPVYAALDPGRFFDRVGVSADVYVVAPRTAAEWAKDPSLVDVSGGAETVTVAPDLQDDIWNVWKSPDAGTASFGADYQVVLDFGQDGTLDPGDVATGVWDNQVLVAHDLSAPGPYATTTIQYSGGTWLGQRTYFPTDIAKMGELPLVVISHGNGHDYTWYDYVGEHLASYGAIVMAHQNNTGPGIETASTTTLTNTDYLLENQDSIESGVLDGHIDSHRIMWIGHSRGGEGVVRAYDRIADGDYTPTSFVLDDIALVVSIAPTVYYDVEISDPHDVTYALIAGTADGDVTGGPDSYVSQFFRISQAAEGEVSTWYVQGADHNDFNCCGSEDSLWWNSSPDILIGRDEAQVIAKSFFLTLWEHYVMGHATVGEYLSRVHDRFHSSGLASDDVVSTTFHHALVEPDLVIDDYQVNDDAAIASGGGAVSYDVTNLTEGLLNDANGNLRWLDEDPMNGMTQAELDNDYGAGVVFDWTADAYYEVALPSGMNDLRSYGYLSFRAAQGSRHPNTLALDDTLTFTVALVDGKGNESAIDIDELGALTETYPRGGLGPDLGWANEFNTVRIPLGAFEADGRAIDRSDIVAVRFEVGPSYGSELGRIGLDDVEVTLR